MELTYLGNSCFSIDTGDTSLLVDPYISDNQECPYDLEGALDRIPAVDAVCVTHLAWDHRGDVVTLARDYDLPVITEPGVNELLRRNGVDPDRTVQLAWGIEARLDRTTVRAFRADHTSTARIDGEYLAGVPLSFLVEYDGYTAYHTGDTALFSDLQLIGSRNDIDVAMVGIGQAYDQPPTQDGIKRVTHEMTIDEAVQATKWLNPDAVVPMHYVDGEREEFEAAMTNVDGYDIDVLPLDPGEATGV